MRSQVEHSKVRSSNPRSRGEMRASAIRCLHTRHMGRSLVEAAIPETLQADHGSFRRKSLQVLRAATSLPSADEKRAKSYRVGSSGSRANDEGWSELQLVGQIAILVTQFISRFEFSVQASFL